MNTYPKIKVGTRTWRIGIVGGGPGGLMTAYLLQKYAHAPFQITLFESSSRLGGKILTPRFQVAPVAYEAGAAEFYDYSPVDDDPLKELIQELGLSISPMGGSGVIQNQQVLASLDDVQAALGVAATECLQSFDRTAKDWMSPVEYYQGEQAANYGVHAPEQSFGTVIEQLPVPATREYLQHLIHSDLATEPALTSVTYGLQNYLMNDARYMQLYSIAGGNEQLPQALAQRISAEICLEHRVTQISRQSNRQLTISGQRRGESDSEVEDFAAEFDLVILSLPNNYLPTIEFPDERLAEAIRRHHEQFNYPAHYLRMTLLFRTPFWRNQLTDSFWMLDQFDGCCLYDESSREAEPRYGVLGWLLAGTAAEELSQLSDAELIEHALQSLPDFMTTARTEFIEGRVHRWLNAVNGNPGGRTKQSLDRRHQPEPLQHPELFVTGDYLFDSTLNGVLDSAEYVANWVAARMLGN